MTSKITTQNLLALIGRQVIYQQHQCEIIELLDECTLVLQTVIAMTPAADSDDGSQIQATQHGEGHREVPMTFSLSAFDVDGELNPELVALGWISEC